MVPRRRSLGRISYLFLSTHPFDLRTGRRREVSASGERGSSGFEGCPRRVSCCEWRAAQDSSRSWAVAGLAVPTQIYSRRVKQVPNPFHSSATLCRRCILVASLVAAAVAGQAIVAPFFFLLPCLPAGGGLVDHLRDFGAFCPSMSCVLRSLLVTSLQQRCLLV